MEFNALSKRSSFLLDLALSQDVFEAIVRIYFKHTLWGDTLGFPNSSREFGVESDVFASEIQIGASPGIAFIWYGLPASVFVHFVGNLVRMFAYDE